MSDPYLPSPLEQVQLDMGCRLQAHPYFANAAIFVLRPRVDAQGNPTQAVMINNNINSILAGVGVAGVNGKLGAAIMVDLPTGDIPYQEAPGPDVRLGYGFRIYENPLINMGATGTGISAENYLVAGMVLFHDWFIQRLGATMKCDKTPFVANKTFLDKNTVAYDVFFTVRMGIDGRPKVPMPGLCGDLASGISIAAVAGASVYYTLDGSYPWSGNPAAVLLDQPILTQGGDVITDEGGNPLLASPGSIPVTAGMLVQAVAYITNKQASNLAALIVS